MNFSKDNHTFAICAYKEVPLLKNCIESLMKQTIKSKIIISTSTPNAFIKEISEYYGIEMYINDTSKGISNDWNFAYELAKTELVTIVHQDDIYEATYLDNVLKEINREKHPLIAYTAYYEVRNREKIYNNKILRIKNMMNYSLSYKWCRKSKFIRRRILSLGCPICCSSVTFVKKNVLNPPFSSYFSASPDWDAWERLSKLKGEYIYINKCLLGHTIAEYSETTVHILNNSRSKEELILLNRYWPKKVAKWIHKYYIKAQYSNELE